MDSEGRRVLELLEAGTITADQAVALLEALRPPERSAQVPDRRNVDEPAARVVPPATVPAPTGMDAAAGGLPWRIGGARISFGDQVARSEERSSGGGAGWRRGAPRWLRLRVLDGHGRSKVDVQLPLALLGLGIRLGARWLPQMATFDPDVVLAAAQLRGGGKLFEAVDDEDGDRVEITLE